jgi:hypothetical protein
MNTEQIERLERFAEAAWGQWWWVHLLLVGVSLGGSLGMWAYRDLWYGVATFLTGPVMARSLWRALRQWLASTLLVGRAGAAVALFLTAPLAYRSAPEGLIRLAAVGGAVALWLFFRLVRGLRQAHGEGPPNLFRHPFRWARYRAVQSPDELVAGWSDALLGALLHAGLGYGWYSLLSTGRDSAWWVTGGVLASLLYAGLLTAVSVLTHPPGVSHEGPHEGMAPEPVA